MGIYTLSSHKTSAFFAMETPKNIAKSKNLKKEHKLFLQRQQSLQKLQMPKDDVIKLSRIHEQLYTQGRNLSKKDFLKYCMEMKIISNAHPGDVIKHEESNDIRKGVFVRVFTQIVDSAFLKNFNKSHKELLESVSPGKPIKGRIYNREEKSFYHIGVWMKRSNHPFVSSHALEIIEKRLDFWQNLHQLEEKVAALFAEMYLQRYWKNIKRSSQKFQANGGLEKCLHVLLLTTILHA